MKTIEVKNLTKYYKEFLAVDNITFDINEGELFSLLGVNGAGKTTTIKMLSGLLNPSSGDAKVLGLDIITDIAKIKSKINISPQETAIAPNLSVYENLEFIASIYGIPKNEIKENVDKVIKDFSLSKVIKKKAGLLSGGYQRRLSIAMAVITKPEVLFLDEPTLGLDVIARRELWKIIKELKKTTTIILTTHYMEEAEMLSDRVAIMKDGKILTIDIPKALVKKTKAKNFEDAFVKVVSEGTL